MRVANGRFRPCVFNWLVLALALLSSSALAEVRLPNGEWVERVEDLRVKVLGGYVAVERTWQAERQNRGEWRWHFNPAWDDLSFDYEVIGEETRLKAIRRAGSIFHRTDDEEQVFVFDKLFIIRKLEGDTGWRWSDRKGNWVRYDRHGRITAYGDRNNVEVRFTRTADNKIHQLLDHHDDVVLTYSYVGNQTAITDRAQRQVKYRYNQDGQITEVEDVLGNVWKYGYSNGLMAWKEDPERPGVRTEITYGGSRVVQLKDAQGFVTQYHYDYDRIKRQYAIRECSPACNAPGARSKDYLYDFEGKLLRSEQGDRIVSRLLRDGPHIDISIDERNLRTTTEYDASRNPIRIRYPDGTEVRMKYEPVYNQLIERVDEAAVKTVFEYDSSGNLVRKIEADGTTDERVTEFDYDDHGQRETLTVKGATVADDAVTRWTYDAYGNVKTEVNAESETTRFEAEGQPYHVTGRPTVRINARQHHTRFQYNAAGRLTHVINPLNHTIEYRYDKVGNRIKVIDPLLKEITFTYTNNNWLHTVTDPLNGITTHTYYDNPYGERQKETDEEGVETEYEYDSDGRLFKVTDGAGNETEYRYGDEQSGLAGLLTAIQYPTYREEYRYDQRNRRTQVIRVLPAGEGQPNERREVTITSYDGVGRVQSVTDPLNRVTLHGYDLLGRLKTLTDPADGVTAYGYDVRDNLIRVTDANDNSHTFVYDKANRLKREERPLDQGIDYTYDDAGNLETRTNAKGDRRIYTYDAADRRTNEDHYPAGQAQPSQTIVYHYDERGRLKDYSQTGDTHSAAVYEYNDKGEKVEETVTYGNGAAAFSRTIEHDHYKNGLLRQFTYPDGTDIDYRYDGANRLERITTPAGPIDYTAYQWQQPARVEVPGAVRSYTYDALQRPRTITVQALGTGSHASPNGTPHMSYAYTYNAVGNITERSTQDGSYAYDYDTLDRLTQAAPPLSLRVSVANPGGLPVEGYAYDPVHNRIQSGHQPGTWQYNGNNELQSYGIGSEQVSYEYDVNGHTTRETKSGTVTDYVYNAGERLTEVKKNNATIASYQYDPMGRRIRKETSGQVTWFQYSEQGLIAEYTGNGTFKRAYGWKPQGLWGTDPVFLADVTSSGTTTFWAPHYYHNDHLGTPQRLTDGAGQQTWAAVNEAFGKTTPAAANTIENPLRFPGQYFDAESGQHYNNFRNYETELGRYREADPLGLRGGMSLYGYAFSNPYRYSDSRGLRPDVACCQDARRANLHIRDGNPDGGMVICCEGRKVACTGKYIRPQLGSDIFVECILEHEEEHFPDVDCEPCIQRPARLPPSRPPFRNPNDGPASECRAYRAEVDCLRSKRPRCGGNTPCERWLEENIARAIGYGNDSHPNCGLR